MSFKKLYIIAGEASGDLHGGKVLEKLKVIHPDLIVRAWGGDHLEAAGAMIDVRYERINFMGFSEVLKNIHKIILLFRSAKKSIVEFNPEALLLIDYPGFNLRMAKWAYSKNIPVYYYIAPQIWAWKENRVHTIKETVRKLFIILPFEKDYFAKHGIQAYYFGHPLLESIQKFRWNPSFREDYGLSNQSIIAILPGSRAQEIKTMLPIYLEAVRLECKYQVVIAGLKQHKSLYEELCKSKSLYPKIIYNDTYNLLHQARLAIVTSGTATLETALFGVPEVVCYKGNFLSYWFAKKLIKVKFISLVNLISNKKVVQELIQSDCTPTRIKSEMNILKHSLTRSMVKSELKLLQQVLKGDKPYDQVARMISKDLCHTDKLKSNNGTI